MRFVRTWHLIAAIPVLLVVVYAAFAYYQFEMRIAYLTANVYHEARSEPLIGQEAVAFVTLARSCAHPRFPATIPEVVMQRRAFSWTLSKKITVDDALTKAGSRIKELAERYARIECKSPEFYAASARLKLPEATFFYKRFDWDENNPKEKRMSERNKAFWRECVEKITDEKGVPIRYGAHVFYKQKETQCDLAKRLAPE